MGLKKGSSDVQTTDQKPPPVVTPPVAGSDADMAQANGQANAPASTPELEAAPMPDPVVALGDDGHERPLSGGSFVRQPDGTLIRNQEA